ncbi:MAG: rhomboid family intramembrane serine protease [Oscillatoriales cyanobacterium C42_A2020_001]|nr:rhomboid family intramembrane serine protease [Leptolyngbyaceae cyanobacterium C42_A2020_001]
MRPPKIESSSPPAPHMTFNLFLIQLVVFTAIFMLTQATRLPRGWLAAIAIVVMALIGSFLTIPEWAGFVSGSLWALLILLPIIGFARVNRLVSQEQYRQASYLASWLRWLHPADGFMEYPQLLHGLDLAKQGSLSEAKQLLSKYETNLTPTGRMAKATLYRMEAQWAELVAWVQSSIPEKTLYREVWLGAAYLRSLGELGDIDGLLQGVEKFEQQLGRPGNPEVLGTVRLYALAFCGQTQSVQRLFETSLRLYPMQTRQFWLATAEMMAGNRAIAQEILTLLQANKNTTLTHAIRWRLTHPLAHPDQSLTEDSRAILDRIKTAIQQEARYSSQLALTTKKSYATYALIGLNVVVFAVESVLGGSEDLFVLYQMGALVPEDVLMGEWWRAIAAIFLHHGVVHLLTNMLGLYVFGALVEAALGRKKYLIAYFFTGIGSMLAVVFLSTLTDSTAQLTVGASGAVLGMVGAEGAIQLKGWWIEKAQIAQERLRLIGMIVILQLFSDLITPQVSIIGHLSGLSLGFLVGGILFQPKR